MSMLYPRMILVSSSVFSALLTVLGSYSVLLASSMMVAWGFFITACRMSCSVLVGVAGSRSPERILLLFLLLGLRYVLSKVYLTSTG